jgi:hypothetical protein
MAEWSKSTTAIGIFSGEPVLKRVRKKTHEKNITNIVEKMYTGRRSSIFTSRFATGRTISI